MKVFSVGDFKAHFSEILDTVRTGEAVAIAYGKRKEIVAHIVPYQKPKADKRQLGLLSGKASVVFADDFKMTEDEFLGL